MRTGRSLRAGTRPRDDVNSRYDAASRTERDFEMSSSRVAGSTANAGITASGPCPWVAASHEARW